MQVETGGNSAMPETGNAESLKNAMYCVDSSFGEGTDKSDLT
jgi:hypothetical protein